MDYTEKITKKLKLSNNSDIDSKELIAVLNEQYRLEQNRIDFVDMINTKSANQ